MTSNDAIMGRAGPSTAEKLRGLPWAIAGISLNTVFNSFVFGTVFVLYLSQLGLSKTAIGSALSLLPFAGVIAPFIAPAVAHTGNKRIFLFFYGARKFVAAALLLAPWVFSRFGPKATLGYVLGVIGLYALCRAIAETGYYPWRQEYTPASVQGKYTALSNVVSTLAGLAAVTVAGTVIGTSTSLNRFLILIGVGFTFGLGMVWSYAHVPGGAAIQDTPAGSASRQNMREALRDRNFLLYMIGISLMSLAGDPAASFLPLFMQEQIGLSPGQVVWLQNSMLLGVLCSGYLWGWAADRYGNKPVILINLFLTILYPLGWMVMPRHSASSVSIAFAINLFRGMVSTGWAVGTVRLFNVGVVPPEKNTDYMAVFYAWIGILGGISQFFAGSLLDSTRNLSGGFLFIKLDPYSVLFIAMIGLAIASIPLFQAIRVDDPVTTREFVATVLRGNPLLAMGSLIGFHLARDETATVSITERLGQTRSLLVVEELLDALADPRFNVRFEAILAIAHTRSDPRLLQALSEVLAGDDPALGVVAAWALGRVGDKRAIPHLRAGLESRYRSIRVHCSRSLGMLQAQESAPILCERLDQETDPGLQLAYASTLGKLRAVEAAPKIFALLHVCEKRGARLELALALARLLGNDHFFIQLARQVRVDASTPLSQAVTAIRKKQDKRILEGAASPAEWNECSVAFSGGNFKLAVGKLRFLLSSVPMERLKPIESLALGECAQRLAEYEDARLEYILLGLHSLYSCIV